MGLMDREDVSPVGHALTHTPCSGPNVWTTYNCTYAGASDTMRPPASMGLFGRQATTRRIAAGHG
jgi:hypothetical protein